MRIISLVYDSMWMCRVSSPGVPGPTVISLSQPCVMLWLHIHMSKVCHKTLSDLISCWCVCKNNSIVIKGGHLINIIICKQQLAVFLQLICCLKTLKKHKNSNEIQFNVVTSVIWNTNECREWLIVPWNLIKVPGITGRTRWTSVGDESVWNCGITLYIL